MFGIGLLNIERNILVNLCLSSVKPVYRVIPAVRLPAGLLELRICTVIAIWPDYPFIDCDSYYLLYYLFFVNIPTFSSDLSKAFYDISKA